jgi:hypothetical protein
MELQGMLPQDWYKRKSSHDRALQLMLHSGTQKKKEWRTEVADGVLKVSGRGRDVIEVGCHSLDVDVTSGDEIGNKDLAASAALEGLQGCMAIRMILAAVGGHGLSAEAEEFLPQQKPVISIWVFMPALTCTVTLLHTAA